MSNWERFRSRFLATPVDRPPVTVQHTVAPAEDTAVDVIRRKWIAEALKPQDRRDTVLMDSCLDSWLRLRS
jgi:hypothetical protein